MIARQSSNLKGGFEGILVGFLVCSCVLGVMGGGDNDIGDEGWVLDVLRVVEDEGKLVKVVGCLW